MDFFTAVERRRSVRKYIETKVPAEVIEKAVDAALLAPNSSNMQTWRIYWVQNAEKKEALIQACLGQGAARTAAELLVFTVDSTTWKTSRDAILKSLGPNPRPDILTYYTKLIPFLYGWRWLAPFKWLAFTLGGFFKPMPRGPVSWIGINEVSVKSAALACENFMLAISAQGFDTCPMEGFDERRVKKVIHSSCATRVVMVISVGTRDEKGIWGERFRLPKEMVFKKI
ncbi:MAG: nitroreductase family protein [Bdellovibrionota bacterium]